MKSLPVLVLFEDPCMYVKQQTSCATSPNALYSHYKVAGTDIQSGLAPSSLEIWPFTEPKWHLYLQVILYNPRSSHLGTSLPKMWGLGFPGNGQVVWQSSKFGFFFFFLQNERHRMLVISRFCKYLGFFEDCKLNKKVSPLWLFVDFKDFNELNQVMMGMDHIKQWSYNLHGIEMI